MKSILIVLVTLLTACTPAAEPAVPKTPVESLISPLDNLATDKNQVPVIHAFVALCDNVHQDIVPVAATLGNGDDAQRNLYWGAAFGVKTFFSRSRDWQTIECRSGPYDGQFVVERCIFKNRDRAAFLVADAYRGSEIKRATVNFLQAAAGEPGETVDVSVDGRRESLHLNGSANLVVYVGHDGLMDFRLTSVPKKRDREPRDAIILACASKSYFADALRSSGAKPLLWTTNLMAPEAYVLAAAIDGWLRKETGERIKSRAAKAYSQYQHCGQRSANDLFATGW